MAFKDLIILIALGTHLCLSAGQNENCNLKEFIQCSNLVSQIRLEGACQQLQTSLTCFENLMVACGLHSDRNAPFCPDGDDIMYCGMLDGSEGAPMAGPDSSYSACRIYGKMKLCHEQNCEPEGKTFTTSDGYRRGVPPNQCSPNAIQKCVTPVSQVSEVNQDTCIEGARAKSCFVDALNDCGGSSEQQSAADIIVLGLIRHVMQCKEQDISFTQGEDQCPPNPMDVFITADVIALKDPLNEVNKESCQVVHRFSDKMDNYLKTCNGTSFEQRQVQEQLRHTNPIRVACYKAGFSDKERNASVKVGGQIYGILLAAAVIFLLGRL